MTTILIKCNELLILKEIRMNSPLLLAHSRINTGKTYTKVGTSTKQTKQTLFTTTHNTVVRLNEYFIFNIIN